jgi:hypothetical protein
LAYNPPTLTTLGWLAPTVDGFLTEQGVAPGDRGGVVLSVLWEAVASDDVWPLWGEGRFLDIVKMEERETWPARFLRIDSLDLGPGV